MIAVMSTFTKPAGVSATLAGLVFAKGHATGNDFVVLPDLDGRIELGPADVAAICDRRRGVGADGVLRVVRTAAAAAVRDRANEAEFFMDYRNADGSLAEMCGNGVRLYARYLVDRGLVDAHVAASSGVAILTRAGRVVARVRPDDVSVDMPQPQVLDPGCVDLRGERHYGTVATCGNPNLVCFVDDVADLDLTGPLRLDPAAFPAGGNVEFLTWENERRVRMRVVERGVGETLSCGSGACAAAAVALAAGPGGGMGELIVDVPGGRLVVRLSTGGCVLTGPAAVIATGTLVG
jgi:diaminopimelate epimerase